MIEVYLLEHLSAFRKHRTLSETAQALHLTQPTLTRSMKKLEELFGVPLFIHEKKRLYLNENGQLAAEYADSILQMQKQMMQQVKAQDRLSRTVTAGFCAPGPLMELTPLLTGAFPAMTISSELNTEENLIRGLADQTYQMIILNHPLDAPAFCSVPCGSEQLYASLVFSHPLAEKDSVSFSELNGENFLMAAEVGIWDRIVREKMPASSFLLQEDTEALQKVADSSSLSGFATDITLRVLGGREGRVSVPFRDPESRMEFYCICPAADKDRCRQWFTLLKTRHSLPQL